RGYVVPLAARARVAVPRGRVVAGARGYGGGGGCGAVDLRAEAKAGDLPGRGGGQPLSCVHAVRAGLSVRRDHHGAAHGWETLSLAGAGGSRALRRLRRVRRFV